MISMVECQARIHNFEEIRRYIIETLSQTERLQPDSTQLTVDLLNRSGQPCGAYFCLHGPRALRLSAIWETDANTILFYGSRGERIQRTWLVEAPQLELQAIDSESLAA